MIRVIPRRVTFVTLAVLAAASVIHADVKTQEKTSLQFGGTLGGLMNRFAGDAAKDGVVGRTAVRGSRKMTANDQTGRIVDLTEEKVYDIDFKKKEYRVTTFAELRKRWEDAQAKAKKDVDEMKDDRPDPRQEGKEYEISLDVKQTGQTKAMAGYNTREVIVTVTMHEKGKTVDAGGGLVMTNTLWLAPKIAALDEIGAFDLKFARAVYGDAMPGVDAAQMGMLLASYPSFKEMSEKMAAEAKTLEGSPLSVTMTLEAVRSPEQLAEAAKPAPSGGGLAGRLAGRFGPKPKPAEARTRAFSSTHDILSVATSVADADLALPAGFKEKK